MQVTNQERNTILAALRFYQEKGMGDPANRSDDIHDIATNGDEEISLGDAGIDALCEKIAKLDDELSRCSDCGALVPEIIGCPDGAETCPECFDNH